LLSYDSARLLTHSLALLSRQQVVSLSQSSIVSTVKLRGEEPNHSTARKPGPLKMLNTLWVTVSDLQCQSFISPGLNPGILRHSGIWGAANEAVLNKVLYKSFQNFPQKILIKREKTGKFRKLVYSLRSICFYKTVL
jgi:hypothetical protein